MSRYDECARVFVEGKKVCIAGSMVTTPIGVYSYNLLIATRSDDVILVRKKDHHMVSTTTTMHINSVVRALDRYEYEYVRRDSRDEWMRFRRIG